MEIEIGSRVRRNTNDYLRHDVGTVIEIEDERARVHWDLGKNRTWFKLENLILVNDGRREIRHSD